MLNNFIYSKRKDLFEQALNNNEVPEEAVAFIEDTKEIYNRNTYFSGDLSKYVKQDVFDEYQLLLQAKMSVIGDRLDLLSPTFVTYQEFKELCDNNNLAADEYCIKNIKTTSTHPDTTVIENEYKFIVKTLSSNSYNPEVLKVFKKIGPYTYEIKDDLKVWYDINNDTSKYSWADPNGTGVIYRMIDKNGNDCPYDFQSIKFKNGDDYYFTFTDFNSADASLGDYCKNNIIATYRDDDNKQILNNIILKGNIINYNVFELGCYNIKLYGDYVENNVFKRSNHTIDCQDTLAITNNEFLNCNTLNLNGSIQDNHFNLTNSSLKNVYRSTLIGTQLINTVLLQDSIIKSIYNANITNVSNVNITYCQDVQTGIMHNVYADYLFDCQFGDNCTNNTFRGSVEHFKLGANSSNNVFYPPLPKELPENTNNMCINGPKHYTFDGTDLIEDTN